MLTFYQAVQVVSIYFHLSYDCLSAVARPAGSRLGLFQLLSNLEPTVQGTGPDNIGMQLLSIKLTNFQAHERLAVDFVPGITTIVGPTDKGKTAILRALAWVAQNNLGGEEFIREGTKEARVELVLTDGKRSHTIVRSKGKVNSYSLNGKEFVSFGQGVPADIARLLQLNEINFQGQHDSPFWFAETAGEVSRKLNAVIDLSIIDSALSAVASGVRQASERKGLYEERLQAAKAQLERLVPQRARVKEFEALKQKEQTFNQAERDRGKLDELLERVLANQAHELRTRALSIQSVYNDARVAVAMADDVEALTDLLAGINAQHKAACHPPDFSPVTQAYDAWKEVEGDLDQLEPLVASIERTARAALALSAAASLAEAKFHKQLKGQKCPLCGNQIS